MQLMILDKKDSWEKQADKLVEETKEVLEAIQEGDKEHVSEEVLDVIQVAIGMLDTLVEEGHNLKPMVCKHQKKLVKRGWKEKGQVLFQVIKWQ